MFKNGKISFKDEETKTHTLKKERLWNILIVDDEPSIHEVTKLALKGFEFEDRKCNFISAYSAKEAKEIIANTKNIALAFVDVVMETDEAGLDLVDFIRKDLNNHLMRLILRTGQPGQAPEEKVIREYDINDYKSKSELTTQKLFTSLMTSLRAYRDMVALEKNRQGLKKIISSTSSIEKMPSLEIFLSAVLDQLGALLQLGDFDYDEEVQSFIAVVTGDQCIRIAGSGKYKELKHDNLLTEYTDEIRPLVIETMSDKHELYRDGNYILYRPSSLEYSGFVLYIKVDKELSDMDSDLIKLFLDNAKIAYENRALADELDASQREIIFTLSEIAEVRSNETGQHVKRVALYSRLLAKAYGLSEDEVDTIYSASPMHDIGKIAISDAVLKKPGKLDDEEMTIMKEHSSIGYNLLKSSKRKILQMSAVIANEHHEKYDGSGYPNGLKGEDINIYARIVALADVFDALGSDRVYKKAWEIDKIFNFIRDESGKHFDPKLVELFFENIDEVLEIRSNLKD